MKILSVSLHNIASIEGPFTLNLEAEPLKSVGLFAITGATGAGKSTLLDAICLALYNNTPRLSSSQSTVAITDSGVEVRANNVKNLLRKGAVSGYAKVVFQAVDGKVYEAEWQVSRAYKKLSGAIQSETMQLTCLTDKQVFAENRKTLVLEKIRECVGLTFDEFTKSVILAQGDFTSFLKANDDKRSDILEKLTGTEIYTRISKQIYELHKQHKTELQLLEKQLESIVFLTEEERTVLTEQLVTDEQQLTVLQTTIASLKAQQQWFADQRLYTQHWQEAISHKETAEKEKASQAERFAKLAIVEQLQAIKTDILTEQKEKEQLALAEKQLEVITVEQQRLTADKATTSEHKIQLETDLTTAKSAYETEKPAITKAKELDVRLTEQQQALLQKEQQNNAKKATSQAQEEALSKVTEHIMKGEEYIRREEEWLTQHPDEAQLHQNALWLTQLIEAQQQLNVEQEKHRQVQQQLTQQLEALKTHHPTIEEYATTDIETLVKQQKAYIAEIQTYRTDREVAKRITQYANEKAKGEKLLQQFMDAQTQTEALLEHLKTEKATAQIACDTAERIYQKTQIENTKDVAFLRKSLVEGEACPVCGSVHHPNAHKAVAEQLVDTVRQEFVIAKKHLENLTKECITKEAELKEGQKHIENQSAQNAERTQLWAQEQERLAQSAYYASYPSEEMEAYLTAKITETERLLTKAENLFEVLTRLKSLTDELATLEKDRRHNDQQRQKHTQQLEYLQLSSSWLTLWKTDLPLFQQQITMAKTDWETHSACLEKYKKRFAELTEERTQLTSSQQVLQREVFELAETIAKEQTQLKVLDEKRKGLLEGKSAQEVETTLLQQIDQTTTLLEQTQKNYNTILLNLVANEKSLETLQAQQQQSQVRIAEASAQIENWLKTYYPTQMEEMRGQLFKWANYSYEWLQSERQTYQALNDRIAKYNTIANEKQQAFEALKEKRSLDLTEEETTEQLTVKSEEEEMLRDRIVTQKSQLIADEKQRITATQLDLEKEKKQEIAYRWQLLNDLIGSSSGNAFRKHAQQYTLDMLLQYANVQMRYLNRRYTLQRIPNSLSLQVIDNDMGAEVRSVYSLSGGESFLVSLALALALSSLSSTKMNVETLFIDEGFGSLDTETLSVALDALESLQNQGKKVGVISHVQEMVERIAVKVEVQKEGNGKSKIVITS